MVKFLRKFFDIQTIAGFELILALYPILAIYSYGALHLYLIVPVLLVLYIVLSKKNKFYGYKLTALSALLIYLAIHFVIWIFVINDPPSYYYNSNIQIFTILISLIIIIPYVNLRNLCSAINLIAVICAGGMVYQALQIMAGIEISPLFLPFMPKPDDTSRVFEIIYRPTSFFVEPQSYVSYLLIPVFLALVRKNLICAIFFSLTILMSGSTTGIAMLAILFGIYFFSTKLSVFYRILIIVAILGLGVFLFFSEYTTTGLEKMNSTDLGENVRIINGYLIALHMNLIEIFVGVPYSNATDFCFGSMLGNSVILDMNSHAFVSAIWIALIQYGIIGLIFYLNVYYSILKKCLKVLPYWLCVVIALFTNPDFVGAGYFFIIIFLYTFTYQYKA